MKAFMMISPFGILAFDERRQLIDQALFPKRPRTAAKAIHQMTSGKIIDEIDKLIRKLRKEGYEVFVFEDANLASRLRDQLDINVEVPEFSETKQILRSNFDKYAVDVGFVKNSEEFDRWVHSLTLEIAKLKVRQAVERKDLIITQAIQTLDDVDRTINLFMGRVREWYGIHFPELDRLLENHETYARLVFKFGSKNNLSVEELKKEGIPKSKAQQMINAIEKSMGADLLETDLAQIQKLCRIILDMYEMRETLEDYLNNAMEQVAPNMKAVIGSLLGARLIALAGGLINLAKMPASTMQILGAEKALFRSLKTGTRPPKHGIIFQHAVLHDSKKWQRGKIARAIAGKLVIAARADAFGGRYVSEELIANLEKRIKEIQEKYVQPPQTPTKKFRQKRRRRNRRAH